MVIMYNLLYSTASYAQISIPESEGYYQEDALKAVNKLKDISMGKADAPVVIYEYLSLTCRYCGDFHTNVFKEIKEAYIDTGKVRFVMREFPLDGIAYSYAVLARCAEDKKFTAINGVLLDEQYKWLSADDTLEMYKKYAKKFGFSTAQYDACITNDALLNMLYDSVDNARDELGINATPTFFINGHKFSGGMSYEEMQAVIENELTKVANK